MGEREAIGTEGEERLQPSPDGQPPTGTVELGDDDAPDKPPSHARCRDGLHHWESHRSEDGGRTGRAPCVARTITTRRLFVGVDPYHR